ncbi:MAG: hypothetical protein NC452_01995 [Eubacterium sp.]|nr:hypothetical protein [Eubacterium sp.]
MRIDLHSHILPGMDDGASDINESLAMLKMLSDAKADKVVLTPHFYRQNENIASFLKRRAEAFEKLSAAADEIRGCPELLLGAEVYFYPSLSSDPDFPKLCIENTDYILLELPFEQFHDNFYSSYAKFHNNCEQKIIFAHIERYLSFGNSPADIMRLFEYGNALCQMNCSSPAEASMMKKKTMLRFISDGLISALGTDAHNTAHRPPMYGKAEKLIVSKCGQQTFDRVCRRSEMILENRSLREIIQNT